MIKEYKNGNDLYQDNIDYLNTNPYISVFFRLDAPLLKEVDKNNYGFLVTIDKHKLIILKVVPYSLLMFGDSICLKEAFAYIMANEYNFENYLCTSNLGDEAVLVLREYGYSYIEALPMDFMEAKVKTYPSVDEVEVPTVKDADDLFYCLKQFVIDCQLLDRPTKERNILPYINDFRIIRRNGKIASMGRICKSTEKDLKISDVYTKEEYRGLGLARKVVNNMKNEILDRGYIATLNVDRRNSITNHLYRSIGFERVFSQGEYRRND